MVKKERKERKRVYSLRMDEWRKQALTIKYGGIQAWVDLRLEEEFAGASEAVIVRKQEVVTEDDF